MARVRWGVLSTASIGRLVIEATRVADHAVFVAVASRLFAGEPTRVAATPILDGDAGGRPPDGRHPAPARPPAQEARARWAWSA
jgi:hypothetical protein